MAKTIVLKALLALVLSTAWSVVFASTISLVPSASSVDINTPFSVNLDLNASDIGNQPYSFQVLVSYDPTFLTFAGFTETVSGTTGSPTFSTQGSLNTILLGIGNITSDSTTIGFFDFTSNAILGTTNLGIQEGSSLGSSFVANLSFIAKTSPLYPVFSGTPITIANAGGDTTVPLPGALWLMLSGLGMLSLRRRKIG
jgi:hypothetical protein